MEKKKIILLTIIIALFLIGCTSGKVVYLRQYDEAIMLRQDVKRVKVWIKTKDDQIIPGKADLREGSFVLLLDEEDLRGMGLEYLIDLIKSR